MWTFLKVGEPSPCVLTQVGKNMGSDKAEVNRDASVYRGITIEPLQSPEEAHKGHCTH